MKVYVVTTGCYSDYSIHSIHSTEIDANRVAHGLDERDAEVVEFDVDSEPVPDNTPEWIVELELHPWRGSVRCDQERVSARLGRIQLYATRDMRQVHKGTWARRYDDPLRNPAWKILTIVTAPTEAAALKVGAEHFQREFARAALAGEPYDRAGAA